MSDEGPHTPMKGEENERRTEWKIRRGLRVEDDGERKGRNGQAEARELEEIIR
jgi:hypothetical protein